MCGDLQKRDITLLQGLLTKYGIDKSVKDMSSYESVFLSIQFLGDSQVNAELKRVVLYANLKYIVQNGEVVRTNKKEILYSYGRKIIKKATDYEVDKTIAELNLIACFSKQLKLITKIELEESDIQSIFSDFDIEG